MGYSVAEASNHSERLMAPLLIDCRLHGRCRSNEILHRQGSLVGTNKVVDLGHKDAKSFEYISPASNSYYSEYDRRDPLY
jgi:hypothetical protein